jgi:hypothetical protein
MEIEITNKDTKMQNEGEKNNTQTILYGSGWVGLVKNTMVNTN